MDEHEADVEHKRREYEALSVGPHGSHVMLADGQVAVFFQVEWDGMDPLVKLAADQPDTDVYCQWVMFSQGVRTSCALDVGWPELGLRRVLYFELDKWSVELALLRDSGLMLLCPKGASGIKALDAALSVPVDVEFLGPMLAAWDILRSRD